MNIAFAPPGRGPAFADAGENDFTSILERLALEHGDRTAITISRAGEETVFDYSGLWQRAGRAGMAIASLTAPGDRVLLPMQTSAEFIEAFFGCIVSGRIAVPLPVEKKGSRFSRLANVVADCAPSLAILRTARDLQQMREGLQGIATLVLDQEDWPEGTGEGRRSASPRSPAFIQYTSGSTSSPKGVLITHGNIVANAAMIRKGMGLSEDDRVVSWLPVHHDLGLMGMLLAPVAARACAYLYPPEEFAKDPAGWLAKASEQAATLTGAPNFAFDLIARKVRQSALEGLDLSSMRLLYCGSERIVASTIRAFYERLAPTGLRTGTFFTCYGMAEASVYVTGGFKDAALDLAPAGAGSPYPSCGLVPEELAVEVRLPSGDLAPAGVVGEVTIAGPSVTPGYWHQVGDRTRWSEGGPEADDEPLRTGDLGFLHEGELVITGRLKDVLKVRGRNIFPEDLETPLEAAAVDRLPANGVVVASTASPDGTRDLLTIVVEIERTHRKGPFTDLLQTFQSLLADHDVRCERMVVLPPLAMPKTSSGKKQRRRTALLVEEGALPVLWDSLAEEGGDRVAARSQGGDASPSPAIDLERMRRYFANLDMVLADERRTFPCDFLKTVHRCGLMAMLVPEEHGGLGLDGRRFAAVGEALGRIDVSLAAVVGIQNTIGLLPVVWSDVLPDRADVLRSIAANGEAVAFALTEPDAAGSNPRTIASRVTRSGGRMSITGEKTWIGNATFATYVDVFAQETDSDGAPIGISAFLLRADRHDYRVGGEQLTLGVRSMPQARVTFEDVEVTDADRLSRPGQGLALAYRAMEYARFGLAAVALGAAQAALELAWRNASERRIATGPLIANGHFETTMAETLLDLAALRAVVGIAAAGLERNGELPQAVSLACKVLAGEVGFEAVDTALQFSGGRGYTETFGVARIWRDVRILRIFEGPTEAVAAHLGSLVARRPEVVTEPLAKGAERHPAVAEAARVVATVASIYGRTPEQDAFHCELGVFAARQMGLAALLSGQCEGAVARAAERKRRSLASAFERRMGELSGLKDALGDLSRCFGGDAAPASRAALLYDAWPAGGAAARPGAPAEAARPVVAVPAAVLPPSLESVESMPAGTDPDRRRGDVLDRLADWIAKAAKVRVVDRDKPIAFYGIDSLLAFELHCFVEDEFDVKLPDSAFAEDLSVRQLGSRIAAEPR